MKKVLAIDLGGGSGRGIVCWYDGSAIRQNEVYRFQNGAIPMGNTLRWDLQRLFSEVKNALASAERAGHRIESLAIDTWGVDYAWVDADGTISEPPYSYRDSRTDGMTEHFPPFANRELYGLTGISINSFNTSYQLYADAKTRDFSSVKTLLFLPNALGYLLTGVAGTEPCIASTSAFYDKKRGFLPEFLNKIGVPGAVMPKVFPTGSILGTVKAEILAELCVTHPIFVIVGAGHDTACAVMSIPTEDKNPLFLSSGTWSLFGAELDEPIVNDLSFQENYTNELGYGNTVRFLKNIMGFWLLQECKKEWSKDRDITTDEIVAASRAAKPFAAMIDVGDMVFNPPGDMPARIQNYVSAHSGVTLEGIPQIARVMFESLALEYRYALEGLQRITGKTYPALYIVGGGSRNDFMCQLTADSLGIPVYAGPAEATAIGNAVGQLIALGEIPDIRAARRIVRSTEKVKYFAPNAPRAEWNDAYQRYLSLKQNNKAQVLR